MGTLLVGTMIWQSIDTAPKDGTEILASDHAGIEIVSWKVYSRAAGWESRLGETMSPAWWQPLPDHPPLPGDEPELPNGSELPDGYIDPGHSAADRELLEAFYLAARSEGGTTDEITLRGIRAATRAAELLQQQEAEVQRLRAQQTPVPVSEEPWKREGWCDESGLCWFGWATEPYLPPYACWSFCKPSERECNPVSLPATALPLPAGEVDK